jgi:hypothetical protein
MCRRIVPFWVVLGLAPVGLFGCSKPPPKQADAQVAKETLSRALKAWQKGESLDAFRKTPPEVTVVEHQWQKGARLVGFELKGDGQPSGFDHQFSVTLSIQDSAAKKLDEIAIYIVSTSPALVIVRSDEGGETKRGKGK